MAEHYEIHKDIYETKNIHFFKCSSLIALRNLTKANLKNVEEITNELKKHIDLVIK